MASFGIELPDQFDALDRRTEAQLVLLQDVQILIRERSSIEAQYSKSLQALAKKADKLNKQHISAAAIGDDPSKPANEDSLKKSTLQAALSFFVDSYERTAQEHMSFSEVLAIQIADELRSIERKKEETRKKHSAFYTKLVADRDQIYGNRSKAQQKYYEDCEAVELYRAKQDKALDDKHADRAAKQYEQTQTSMANTKNTYVISIAVANKAKELFYADSVATAEDQYQTLQTSITSRLVFILQNYSAFNLSHLSTLTQTVTGFQKTLAAVDHSQDHHLFTEYNKRPFTVPNDWSFEPCPSFYDTPDVVTEQEPKIFLQNKLSRIRARVQETIPVMEAKEREASRLEQLAKAYTEDPGLGSPDGILDDAFAALHAVAHLRAARVVYEEEAQSIVGAIGDDQGGRSPHVFKSSSFAVPTQCSHCKNSVWGLSKQGKSCKACGIAVHAKCELMVPADCSGSPPPGASRHKSTKSVVIASSAASTVSTPGSAGSTRSSVPSVHSFANAQGLYLTTPKEEPPSSKEDLKDQEDAPSAVIVFDFIASSPLELSVTAGMEVILVEDDDGSGWVKVSNGRDEGLVPTAYVRVDQGSGQTKAPLKGQRRRVRGLYEYEANGDDELNVVVGRIIELTPSGESYADGWYEGVGSDGKKGIFPSNYVEFV